MRNINNLPKQKTIFVVQSDKIFANAARPDAEVFSILRKYNHKM